MEQIFIGAYSFSSKHLLLDYLDVQCTATSNS
jgi:hypothetical protein